MPMAWTSGEHKTRTYLGSALSCAGHGGIEGRDLHLLMALRTSTRWWLFRSTRTSQADHGTYWHSPPQSRRLIGCTAGNAQPQLASWPAPLAYCPFPKYASELDRGLGTYVSGLADVDFDLHTEVHISLSHILQSTLSPNSQSASQSTSNPNLPWKLRRAT